MPSDRVRWGRFTELQDRNFQTLRRILEAPGGSADIRKARDNYAACVDEATIERRGLAPLGEMLSRIDRLPSVEELPALVGQLHDIGVRVFFAFGSEPDLSDATKQRAGTDQSGLGLPDRDYYLKTDARSEELRRAYKQHVHRMLELTGVPAGAAADGILAFERTLADASMDRVTRRNPQATEHNMTLAAFRKLTPAFNWDKGLPPYPLPLTLNPNASLDPAFANNDEVQLIKISQPDIGPHLFGPIIFAPRHFN